MIQNNKPAAEAENETELIETGNNLFPVFLKLENLRLLIVGGGKVALEKLNAVLQNSPGTQITMVAIEFNEPTPQCSHASFKC
ncbi:MAG: NAD(P)-dependent oxidoreductase [Chitinophagaceae bacterium]